MRPSLAVLSVVLVGCGSQPADQLDAGSNATPFDVTFDGVPQADASECRTLVVEPGPAYSPDPSWGTTRAIADGNTIFATIPFQSDAVDSHYVTAYVDGVEVERQLVGGQLNLESAANGHALVRYREESGNALVSVSVDGDLLTLSEEPRTRTHAGRTAGLWAIEGSPISTFNGTQAVGIEEGSRRASYFDPPLQTSLRVPVQDGFFLETEIAPTGFVASVRSSTDPPEISIHRWTRDDDWEEITVGAVSREPQLDVGDAGIFWTDSDGIYRSLGAPERIFEGDCGPVDAFGQFATWACFGGAGEFPSEPSSPLNPRRTLWAFDGSSIREIPTGDGYIYAPRVSATAIAWVEYQAESIDALCQMDAVGNVYLAAIEDPEPTAVGEIGIGCSCCAFPGEPLRFSLSSDYVVWNYPDPADSPFPVGWAAARYDVGECD